MPALPPPFLQVPPFLNPKDFLSYGGIRTYLGNYGLRFMTLQEAQSIGSIVSLSGSTTTLLRTIFISIASYCDNQCTQTVTSIFMRAKYPQRIRVGVVIDKLDFECTTLSSVDCTKKGHHKWIFMKWMQPMLLDQYVFKISFVSSDYFF
jgi:hypothetical protein